MAISGTFLKSTRRQPTATRRQVLQATPGLLLACTDTSKNEGDSAEVAAERSPEPDPFVPTEIFDTTAFPAAVAVGDATPEGAVVSVQTMETTLSLVLLRGSESTWTELFREEALPAGGTFQATLSGLDADTPYTVYFTTADGRRSATARFRTAMAAGESRIVRFGASSCMGGNSPWPSLTLASAERYDFFLLLGDTIYADGSVTQEDYEVHWSAAFATSGLQDLLRSTSIIATWDDHEVGNNWTWADEGIEEKVLTALERFQAYIPASPGTGDMGITRKLSWGLVADVFVLDCRGERRDERYLSVEQTEWLKESLRQSTARFKIILNSVPITSFADIPGGTIYAEDRWQGFVEERTAMLQFLVDEAIGGVLWVAGDLHFAVVARVDPPGEPGENQWEVLVGPCGSQRNPLAAGMTDTTRYPMASYAWNYTAFEADPVKGTVRVSHVGDDGVVIAEVVLAL